MTQCCEKAIYDYKVSKLKPGQKRIFNAITDEWQTTRQISDRIGSGSGIISQLFALRGKGLIDSREAESFIMYWKLKTP